MIENKAITSSYYFNNLIKIYSFMHKIAIKSIHLLLLTILVSSCSKKNVTDDDPIKEPDTKTTRIERLTDSLFYYAADAYLWNTDLPTYKVFDPRQYSRGSNEYENLTSELFAITRYGINPKTNQPFEYGGKGYENESKYSYIDEDSYNGSTAVIKKNELASLDLEGNGNDFGLIVGLYDGVITNYEIKIQAVHPGSPAALAGVVRGDVIKEINGSKYGSNINNEISAINKALFNSQSTTIKGTKVDGKSFDITLNKTSYKTKSLSKDSVYTSGASKIGYLVFNSFSSLEHTQADLTNTFNKFQAAGVTDLIIDLRYNGGGYINTAEFIANKIAPASLNGKVMFSEHFNTTMQNNKTQYLKNLPYESTDKMGNPVKTNYGNLNYSIAGNTYKFVPNGNLNIKSVVFIVTSRTASASELLINILKPYLSVKLVGEKTYGKPVGFFPLLVGGYEVYMSMFTSKNSNNEADYFDGMSINNASDDDANYELGNLKEASLQAAYNYINTGNFANTPSALASRKTTSNQFKKLRDLSSNQFKGMVEDRVKTK